MTAGYDPIPFRVSVVQSGRRAVIRLAGELDVATAPQLEAVIEDLLRTDPPELVVVDAVRLTFADVIGLGILLETAARLQPDGHLEIRGAGRQLTRVVSLLGHPELITDT